MKVGTLEIEGTLDSSGITSSLTRIEESIRSTGTQTKTALGPMTRLGNELSSALKKATFLGIAGVGAMTALATKAPAVAPAIAKMGVEMMKISHSLGEVMAPIFEEVADTLLPAIGSAIDNNREKIEAFLNVGIVGVKWLSDAIDKLFKVESEVTSADVISAIENPEQYLKSIGALPKTKTEQFVEFTTTGKKGYDIIEQANIAYESGEITRGQLLTQIGKGNLMYLLQGAKGAAHLLNLFWNNKMDKDMEYASIDAAGVE